MSSSSRRATSCIVSLMATSRSAGAVHVYGLGGVADPDPSSRLRTLTQTIGEPLLSASAAGPGGRRGALAEELHLDPFPLQVAVAQKRQYRAAFQRLDHRVPGLGARVVGEYLYADPLARACRTARTAPGASAPRRPPRTDRGSTGTRPRPPTNRSAEARLSRPPCPGCLLETGPLYRREPLKDVLPRHGRQPEDVDPVLGVVTAGPPRRAAYLAPAASGPRARRMLRSTRRRLFGNA